MIEMLNEARFSTSTSPWRSNITPRGARRGGVRWWLFSAISRNLACWKTWKNQKPASSRPNAAVMRRRSAAMRVCRRRRSSTAPMAPMRMLRRLPVWSSADPGTAGGAAALDGAR